MSLNTILTLGVATATVATCAVFRRRMFNESMEDFWSRIARWLICTVFAALAPLGLDYLKAISDRSGKFPPIDVVYGHGELCIVSAALAGVALGELLGLSEKAKVAKVVLGGFCGLAIFGGAGLYTVMKGQNDAGSLATLSYIALWGFLATFVVSTCSIGLAELRK